MNKHIICEDLLNEIDGKTIPQVIGLLEDYQDVHGNGRLLTLYVAVHWDTTELQIVHLETKQEKQERLLREKEAKAAKRLEEERKRYLELKAKFEGE